MKLVPFRKIHSENEEINRLQQNIDSVFKQLSIAPVVNSVRLEGVVLKAGQVNIVNHKLDTKLTGWILTRNKANSVIWDSQDSNNDPTKTLALHCSVDTVVDLLVF